MHRRIQKYHIVKTILKNDSRSIIFADVENTSKHTYLKETLGEQNRINHNKSGKWNNRTTQEYSNIKYILRIINHAKSNINITTNPKYIYFLHIICIKYNILKQTYLLNQCTKIDDLE